ncbi:MAG: hypothetical protein R2865_14810 [Deinococcales bacterium]
MQKFQQFFRSGNQNPTGTTPQNLPIDSKQIANNAGGYVWELSPYGSVSTAFWVLGTEGGSFYVSERQLTIEQAGHVVKLLSEDPTKSSDAPLKFPKLVGLIK